MKTFVKNILNSRLFRSNIFYLNDFIQFGISFFFYLKGEKITKRKRWFADKLKYYKSNTIKGQESGILLVQMVRDFEYTIKVAAASKAIAEKKNLRVTLHDSYIYWTKRTASVNFIFKTLFTDTYKKIHLSFADSVDFKNSDKYENQDFIKNQLEKIIFDLNNQPESILAIKFEDILVGDLIYDTYLRFFHKPTIEIVDEDVRLVIETALNIFYNFSQFLKGENVKALLNIYTAYINHGITARICLHNNIEVYTLGSNSYILKKLTREFPYHQIDHTLFSPENQFPSYKIEMAKNQLTLRFKGKIDAATSYMRNTAFTDARLDHGLIELFNQRPRNIVLYVHDFYDSPHVNRMLQFPDLYQYLKQTLTALESLNDTSVFIKTHPNGMEGSKEMSIQLVNSFNSKNFYILDESVSNLNIIELKPTLVATARGTVGIEMAYFGIPTVALYDNMYVNFNFVHSATTKEEYFSILRGESEAKIDFDKEKIYTFYYQAFIEKKLSENNNIFDILSSFTSKFNTYSDQYLEKIDLFKDVIFAENFIEYYQNNVC